MDISGIKEYWEDRKVDGADGGYPLALSAWIPKIEWLIAEHDRITAQLTSAKEEIERLATRNRDLEDASDAIGILFRGRRGLEDIIKLRKRAEAAEFLLTAERKETERLRGTEEKLRASLVLTMDYLDRMGNHHALKQEVANILCGETALQERQGEE